MNTKGKGNLVRKQVYISILSFSLLAASATSLIPGSVLAIEEFDIDIDIEKDPIERGSTQHITVTVRNDDSNNRVDDADVELTVEPPEGDSSTASTESNDNGVAKFDVKIDSDAVTGEYDIEVEVSKDDYETEDEETSFDVIKSEDDDKESKEGGVSVSVSAGTASAAASGSSGSSSSPSSSSGGDAAASASQ